MRRSVVSMPEAVESMRLMWAMWVSALEVKRRVIWDWTSCGEERLVTSSEEDMFEVAGRCAARVSMPSLTIESTLFL